MVRARYRSELTTRPRVFPPVGVALLVVGVAAIPFRLAYPVAALLTVGGATLTYSSLDYAKGPMFVSRIVTFGSTTSSPTTCP